MKLVNCEARMRIEIQANEKSLLNFSMLKALYSQNWQHLAFKTIPKICLVTYRMPSSQAWGLNSGKQGTTDHKMSSCRGFATQVSAYALSQGTNYWYWSHITQIQAQIPKLCLSMTTPSQEPDPTNTVSLSQSHLGFLQIVPTVARGVTLLW